MDNTDLAFQYERAEGPNGLRRVLDDYFAKFHNDSSFADQENHYILYTLGEQRSLIRVDTGTMPFHFRYCDLLGRPATRSVKDIIAQFLWDKCGEKERYMKELTERELP